MRPFVYYSFALFLTASTAYARSYGACTGRNGLGGTCIARGQCSASGGSYEPGLCPGPTDIQCCTKPNAGGVEGVGSKCTISGVKGRCQVTSTSCSGSYTPGFCPGPSNVQCCTASSKPPTSPTPPSPGGGGDLPHLNAKQSGYARTIASVAKSMGLPKRACEVGIATAFQESNIRVLANPGVPGSQSIPNDGTGKDHDSVGIFQQRPKFWCPGKVQDCMDPESSARKFFEALRKVKGWENMRITDAAQRVQRSAFGEAYQKHAGKAADICNQAW